MLTREFITAGRAVFTVANNKGDHYTFRVNHKDECTKEVNGRLVTYPEAWFINLLTGPDNTSSYTYLGKLDPETGDVTVTHGSRFGESSVPVRVIRWALRFVWAGREFPEGYKLYHEGACGRCGRPLTVPESIESGIGPECSKIIKRGPVLTVVS